ncbi:PAS domain S-box protein [Desulfonatronum thioautotrophicum]|uniref:PAS domain S-box protein n=1 Tax=Desulfonatronum thioautotrophicum TaxID=617001 RepID=UPI0005EB7794|nr:PAS domain S-box protein [Desulfonatronum thioautotrophicum]
MSEHPAEHQSDSDLHKALQDLREHQVELKMQNEELRRTQQELEASRSQYFDLYDMAPVGYCTLTDKGLLREANLTLANLLGMKRGEILRKPLALFVHKQDHGVFYRKLKLFLEKQTPMNCEVRMIGPGSDCIWARMQGAVREGKKDDPSFRVIVTDITKRIQAREARLKTEGQFRVLVDNSPEAIFIQTQGRFAYANKACLNLYGANSLQDLLGTPVLERVHPDIRALVQERIRLLNEQHVPASLIEQKQFTLDGRLIHVEVSAVPFHYNGHDGAMVFTRDITERKQDEDELQQYRLRLEQLVEKRTEQLQQEVEEHRNAREALQEGEEKYRQLFENSGDAVFIADATTGMIVDVNLQAQHLTGYDLDTLRSMHQSQLHPKESAEQTRKDFELSAMGTLPVKAQILVSASGLRIPVEVNAAGVFEAGGKRFLIGIFRDITERSRAEKQERQSRDRLRMVLDSMDALVYISDVQSHEILFVNEYGLRIWGDVVGRKCWETMQKDMTGPCSFCESLAVLDAGRDLSAVHSWEYLSTVTGRWYESREKAISWVDGRVVRLVIATDITDRKEAGRLQEIRLELIEYASNHSLQKLLARMLDLTEADTDSSISFLHFVEPDQKTLTLQQWSTSTRERFCKAQGSGMHYSIDSAGVWVECVRQDRPVIHNDYASLAHRKGLPAGHAPVLREMVVPIRRDGKLVAIIGVGNKQSDYLQSDADRLSRLTDLIWDIVKRKQIEERLLEQEQMYRGLVESQNDLIVRVDTENRFVFVNETYCRTFGKSREELIGRSFAPLVHEDDIQVTLQAMEQLKVPPHRCQLEQRAMTVDGWRWLHWEDSAILEKDGQIVEIQGVGRDITALKQAEETLRNAEKRLSLAQSFARTGVWEYDIKKNSLFWSRECEALFGLEEGEFEGTYAAFLQRVHPEDREFVVKTNEPIVDRAEGVPLEYEHRIVLKDGTVRWVKESAGVVRDVGGNPIRIVGFVMDITEFKRVEDYMVRARREAEAANRAKTTFLANMSHELRTPMNAVLGFAGLLQRDPALSPEQAEKARLIHANGQNLLRMLNEILDMSKIEAGQIFLNTEDFFLSGLLRETADMFRPLAEAKGLGFALEIGENLPEVIHADQGKLRQIMFNLLGNALKFTNSGRVILRCHVPTAPEPSDAKVHRVSIEVVDTGPGITEQEMSLIFDPFHQTDTGIKAGGTGLGLPISREYARLMGGDLTVTTREGQGSCFHVTVTAQPAAGEPLHKTAIQPVVGLKPGTGSRRILIVDDRPDNLRLLAELLRPVGFEVREATNGAEALAVFEEWLPHAILMDMRMPVMDGYEATRRIKSTEAGRQTYVVALTAWVYKDALEKCIASGVDTHLTKPFKDSDLFDTLAQGLDLQYLYAEDQPSSPLPVSQTVIAATRPAFPPPLVHAILEAVDSGDIFRMKDLTSEADQHDHQAAILLRNFIDSFDYSGIKSWLELE